MSRCDVAGSVASSAERRAASATRRRGAPRRPRRVRGDRRPRAAAGEAAAAQAHDTRAIGGSQQTSSSRGVAPAGRHRDRPARRRGRTWCEAARAMSPSAVRADPSLALQHGSSFERVPAVQNLQQHGHAARSMSRMHARSCRRGTRRTRRMLGDARVADRAWSAITSWPSAASNAPSAQAAARPRRRGRRRRGGARRHASANCGAGSIAATRVCAGAREPARA